MKIKFSIFIFSLLAFLFITLSGVYAEGYEMYSLQLPEFSEFGNEVISPLAINTGNATTVSDPGKSIKTYSAGGTNLFKFVPGTTGFYSIKAVSADSSTTLYLYNSSGNQILSCNYGRAGDNIYDCHMGETLTANTTYYVQIKSTKAETFPVYFYADDHSDGTNVPTVINAATDYSGQLNYNADRDVFSFSPSLSGRYAVRVSGGEEIIARMYKDIQHTAADIVSAERIDDTYTIIADFAAGNTYYIDVYGQKESTTGNYTLNVSTYEGIDIPLSADGIFFSDSQKNVTLASNSSLVYQLDFSQTGKYYFESAYNPDLSVKICESTGEVKGTMVLEYEDGAYSTLLLPLSTDKSYYMVVSNNANSSLNVNVSFYLDDAGNNYGTVSQISAVPATYKINYPGDRDVFILDSGCRIMSDMDLSVDINESSYYNYVDSYTGKEVSYTNDTMGSVFVTVAGKSIDSTGEYTIMSENSEPSYTMVQPGHTYNVEINSVGETKLFKFIPSKSGNYYFDAGGVGYDYTMEVLDFCYNSIRNGGMNTGLNFSVWLEKNKTYYFRAGIAGYTGEYSFSFAQDDYASGQLMYHPNSISANSFIKGELDYAGDTDYFDVGISSGMYRIRNTTPTEVDLTVGTMYGSEIASGDEVVIDFSEYEYDYPFLAVSGKTNDILGKYLIIPELIGDSVSVPVNYADIVNVEIKDSLEQDQTTVYTLSFSSSDFEVFDANGKTFKPDTVIGDSGNGILINSVNNTSVTFTVVGDGSLFEEIINVIKLRAKRTGVCRYSLTKTVS